MSRRWYLVTAVTLLGLVALSACADTSRTLGMGNTVVGVDTSASAWGSNAALLPYVEGFGTSKSPWPCTAEFTAALGDDVANIQFIDLSLRDAKGGRGFGAGYANFGGEVDVFGVGYGQELGFLPGLSAGLTVSNADSDDGDDTFVDLGLAYRQSLPAGDLMLGLVVRDLTDQVDTGVDVGASIRLPSGLTVAADWVDVGDADIFNAGAEWRKDRLAVRVGVADGDLTAGVGYIWRNFDVGFAWQDWGDADAYFGSASVHF